MNTNAVTREKYLRLMTQVEELEERIADLEAEVQVSEDAGTPADLRVIQDELQDLRTELGVARTELQRLSDGCGKPRC